MVVLTSCQRNSLRIEGRLDNLADGPIYLSVLDSSLNWKKVDTSMVEGGVFCFDGGLSFDEPECMVLSVGNQNMSLFAANDNVFMSGNVLRPEDIKVSGSKTNDALVAFAKGIPDMDRLRRIEVRLAAMGNDIDRQEDLLAEALSIKEQQLTYIRNYMTDNATSPVAPFILFNNISRFSFDEVSSFLTAFQKVNPDHKYVRLLSKVVSERAALNKELEKLEVGRPAPDFALPNAAGDTVSLSSFRGKMVLVEFWSSDDGESRRANETIVEVYRKFASKGLEVVCVSTDTDREAWLAAIQQDGLPGHQLIDDGSAASKYVVRNLPFSVLIDENGNIVSKDNGAVGVFDNIKVRFNN